MADHDTDLAAAYALDALPDDERNLFEAHLASCAECRTAVAVFTDDLGMLAERGAITPPPAMRAATFGRIGPHPAAGDGTATVAETVKRRGRGARLRPRTRVLVRVAAVAAVAAVVVGAVVVMNNDTDPVDRVLAAPDATTMPVGSERIPSGEVTISRQLMQGVFRASGLPPVSAVQTYQLWLIGEGGAVPAGLFVPDAGGSVEVLIDGDIVPGVMLGLTVEPSGGSPAPTGDILLAAPIT